MRYHGWRLREGSYFGMFFYPFAFAVLAGLIVLLPRSALDRLMEWIGRWMMPESHLTARPPKPS
jgi:lauroyl/myristoyl acyltransferase